MKKLIFFLSVVLAMAVRTDANAQSAQVVYFELWGPGLTSFNYDTRFTGRNDGIGGRIGIGGATMDGDNDLVIPLGLNYLVGNNKHYFEIGGGLTLVPGDSNGESPFNQSFGHILLGYRLHPPGKGFSFRAFLSPLFAYDWDAHYVYGFSFGYKF